MKFNECCKDVQTRPKKYAVLLAVAVDDHPVNLLPQRSEVKPMPPSLVVSGSLSSIESSHCRGTPRRSPSSFRKSKLLKSRASSSRIDEVKFVRNRRTSKKKSKDDLKYSSIEHLVSSRMEVSPQEEVVAKSLPNLPLGELQSVEKSPVVLEVPSPHRTPNSLTLPSRSNSHPILHTALSPSSTSSSASPQHSLAFRKSRVQSASTPQLLSNSFSPRRRPVSNPSVGLYGLSNPIHASSPGPITAEGKIEELPSTPPKLDHRSKSEDSIDKGREENDIDGVIDRIDSGASQKSEGRKKNQPDIIEWLLGKIGSSKQQQHGSTSSNMEN